MRASTVGSRFLDRCGDSLGVEISFKDICILAAVLNSRCRSKFGPYVRAVRSYFIPRSPCGEEASEGGAFFKFEDLRRHDTAAHPSTPAPHGLRLLVLGEIFVRSLRTPHRSLS